MGITLLKVLMERDGLTEEEANLQIDEAKDRVLEGEDPEEVLDDMGLEPDYVLDILDF